MKSSIGIFSFCSENTLLTLAHGAYPYTQSLHYFRPIIKKHRIEHTILISLINRCVWLPCHRASFKSFSVCLFISSFCFFTFLFRQFHWYGMAINDLLSGLRGIFFPSLSFKPPKTNRNFNDVKCFYVSNMLESNVIKIKSKSVNRNKVCPIDRSVDPSIDGVNALTHQIALFSKSLAHFVMNMVKQDSCKQCEMYANEL